MIRKKKTKKLGKGNLILKKTFKKNALHLLNMASFLSGVISSAMANMY
jgi:hypothetical protein